MQLIIDSKTADPHRVRSRSAVVCIVPAVMQYRGPSIFPSPAATGRVMKETVEIGKEAAERAKLYYVPQSTEKA